MSRRVDRILGAVLLLTCLAAASCKNGARTGLPGRSPEPSMDGTWLGNLNTATSTTTLTMTMLQDTVNAKGTFNTTQIVLFGSSGPVTGVTTGPSFLMTLTSYTSGCSANINIGGTNDGSTMAFSFTGVDCSSASIAGQGYFTKQQ